MSLYSGTSGGVGKSTLAANLAAYIAENHFPVLLVDFGVDETHRASKLHGVELEGDEVGVLQAWFNALKGEPLLQPAVKPSRRAEGVYVMPPGPVSSDELGKYEFSIEDVRLLGKMILDQAKLYRTPLIIIDAPTDKDVRNFALAMSHIVLVVLSGYENPISEFNAIIKNEKINDILTKRKTFVVINMEDKPININTSFKVFHIPFSPEVGYHNRRYRLFIKYEPQLDSGRRWQTAVINLAKTIIKEI